jgi:hypothetical protein
MLSGSKSTLGLLGGASFFGTVLTLILPGAVGSAPWIAALLKVGAHALNHDAWEGAAPYRTSLLSVLLIGSALLFGMLFHELGTYVEAHFFDQNPRAGLRDDHLREWHAFLRTAYERVPVGHRYLRSVVQGMFFELSIAGAFVSLGLGLVACRCLELLSSDWLSTLALASAAWMVACFAIHAAEDSHAVLADTRHVLLRGTRMSDRKARLADVVRRPNPPTLFRCFGSLAFVFSTMVLCTLHAVDRPQQASLFATGLAVLTAWRAIRAVQLYKQRKKSPAS